MIGTGSNAVGQCSRGRKQEFRHCLVRCVCGKANVRYAAPQQHARTPPRAAHEPALRRIRQIRAGLEGAAHWTSTPSCPIFGGEAKRVRPLHLQIPSRAWTSSVDGIDCSTISRVVTHCLASHIGKPTSVFNVSALRICPDQPPFERGPVARGNISEQQDCAEAPHEHVFMCFFTRSVCCVFYLP